MRIGIDPRLVYYTRAGIGEYTLRLTQALADGFPGERFVLLQDFRSQHPLIDAQNVTKASSLVPSHHRLEQQLLPWMVNRLQLAAYHSPDFIPPLHGNCPSVITIHDLAFLIYPHFLTRDSARRWADRPGRPACQAYHRRVGEHKARYW